MFWYGRCRSDRSPFPHQPDAPSGGQTAEHITGTPPGPAGLERLYRDSEGNPLFVVEALRPDAPAAQQVQAVTAGRLARLSPPAAATAGVAAIGEFPAHAPGLASAGAPLSQMVVFRIGQGIAAVPDEATAFSHRDARYLFHPISIWADPADDERMIATNRAFTAAMWPHSTGAAYLNFTPEADRVRDAYGDAKYARLVALKDATTRPTCSGSTRTCGRAGPPPSRPWGSWPRAPVK
jgi:hypothetical protein